MNKRMTVGMIAAGALGVGVMAGVALPASAGTSSGTTAHYVGTPEKDYSQDVKPAGDSLGDRSVGIFRLATTSGKPAGTISNDCVLLRPGDNFVSQCYGQVTLPDGTLAIELSPGGGPTSTAAVLGGTGRYVGAEGLVITTFQANNKLAVTVKLR